MKKTISILIKTSVSVFLLVYLFRKTDLKEVWQLLQQVYIVYIIAALGLYITGQIFCAYRWKLLARLMDFHNSFKEFVVYSFAGMFFSLFLPTVIGGDVGKCYYLARGNKKTFQAVVSILADRGTGLVALTLISGLSLYLFDGANIPRQLTWGILFANVVLIIGFVIPFFLGNHLSRFGKSVALSLSYWRKPLSLFQSIMISLLFQIMIIVIHILIGLSIGLNIPWRFYFFLIPLVVTASMLPVSLSGLGLREGAYVYFLSLVDVPKAKALTFAFGWLFIVIVSSLIGGLVLLTNQVSNSSRKL